MNVFTLGQTTGVRLVVPDPVPVNSPVPSAIDPLWVLIGLVAGAVLVAAALIARSVWADSLQRRPSDVAYWILALGCGVRPWRLRLLRRVARALGPDVHPVALLCSPGARSAAAAAFIKGSPTPRDITRLLQTMARMNRGR